jgi:DNA polymerase-3 subunit epsilon
MYICGIDFETNGLNINDCAVVECGLVLWDTEKRAPVKLCNFLIQDKQSKNYGDWKVCETISNIDGGMIQKFGYDPGVAMDIINEYFEDSKYVLASNGNKFDKPLIQTFANRYNVELTKREWLDLIQDVPFPESCKHRELMYLAAYYGFVNPFPHRALTDVLTMFKIFDQYDLEEILETFYSPKVTLIANVSYKDKELAKAKKFRWTGDTTNPNKKWVKVVTETWMKKNQKELCDYAFNFDIIEGDLTCQ